MNNANSKKFIIRRQSRDDPISGDLCSPKKRGQRKRKTPFKNESEGRGPRLENITAVSASSRIGGEKYPRIICTACQTLERIRTMRELLADECSPEIKIKAGTLIPTMKKTQTTESLYS